MDAACSLLNIFFHIFFRLLPKWKLNKFWSYYHVCIDVYMKLLTHESLTGQTCNDFPEAVILNCLWIFHFFLLFICSLISFCLRMYFYDFYSFTFKMCFIAQSGFSLDKGDYSMWSFFKFIYFLIEGSLLYWFLLFSAKPQHESARGVCIFCYGCMEYSKSIK